MISSSDRLKSSQVKSKHLKIDITKEKLGLGTTVIFLTQLLMCVENIGESC